jgi:two-component system, LytTR family, sensor kinase
MPFFGYTLLFLIRAFFNGTFTNFYRNYSFSMHMSGYFPVLTAAVFGSFFFIIINWFVTINQKAELDKQRLAVELNLLKNKLNPHFLFNTLNNIDSLIHKNPDEASEALIRMSEIMRYLTYETSSDTVPLEKEISYITNIIELHRLRIKSSDDIKFIVSGDMNVMISPALFIPLIENAFKFVCYGKNKPCIDISINSDKGIIVFNILNYFERTSKSIESPNSGFGITNLRKRLEVTYSGKYQLLIDNHESVYCVKLIIDTNET